MGYNSRMFYCDFSEVRAGIAPETLGGISAELSPGISTVTPLRMHPQISPEILLGKKSVDGFSNFSRNYSINLSTLK